MIKKIGFVLLMVAFFIATIASVLIIYGSYAGNLSLVLVATIMYGISSLVGIGAITMIVLTYRKKHV